jgi:hypothetical protein
MFDGLPNLRLPEAPGIRNAPTLRRRPDDAKTPPAQSHLPTTGTGHTARSLGERRSRSGHRRPVNGRRWLNHSDLIAFAVATGWADCCTNTNSPRSRSHYARTQALEVTAPVLGARPTRPSRRRRELTSTRGPTLETKLTLGRRNRIFGTHTSLSWPAGTSTRAGVATASPSTSSGWRSATEPACSAPSSGSACSRERLSSFGARSSTSGRRQHLEAFASEVAVERDRDGHAPSSHQLEADLVDEG